MGWAIALQAMGALVGASAAKRHSEGQQRHFDYQATVARNNAVQFSPTAAVVE